ncbi:hypothetical protein PMSD_08835 [Paenibacillus macquariensis subsp. defensor]|uniref:DNA-directed RNA polymerase subunit beta n=1 Tax=Paenibacillus macquariensis TaxID=948756 RepID=A0ABY1K6S1_9BACL|nr:DNA-directed RNA polymerase subunit beta [Paenibacillus macquariensis]MEC0092558.1 DNA-directed RNA polymerase subunit beta [Paenibacillus macquariensis]OAB35509.1 hypothetical protein PMSM_09665 [Paenibacillus macquariensis subsp. macquariensis]OAB37652.1 hypothetical protein PMSD_08835 [Paenibacillus macquariensis subsp. defensor]SIR34592.1 DNA-directed RNA polymerase subunit beta [Paenibacillus macquariensis]
MSEERKPTQKSPTPRWRIVLRFMIPLFLLLALVGGMMVGYVVMGKRSMSEVFIWDTWKHVFDLVFAP